jgi:hypothetical protein
MEDKVKNIVLVIDGGLGREISASVVIRELKNKYKDKNIIAVSGFNEIFLYNPNVKKTFNFNNPLYFYDDYVNEETKFLKIEPYLDYEYINKKSHLVESWCNGLNIECKEIYPDFYYLPNEERAAQIYVDKITEGFKKKFIMLQWIGGKIPQDKTKKELMASLSTMYRRSLRHEEAQKLVNILKEKGYVIGTVGHENYPELVGTEKIFFPIRSTILLLKYAETFIGIDSFLQHAAAAKQINKKGIVCWGGTTPKCLGYDCHINLTKEVCSTPFCHRPNSYIFDVQPHGAMWDCPNDNKCMISYTADEIIKVFEENFEVKKEVVKE